MEGVNPRAPGGDGRAPWPGGEGIGVFCPPLFSACGVLRPNLVFSYAILLELLVLETLQDASRGTPSRRLSVRDAWHKAHLSINVDSRKLVASSVSSELTTFILLLLVLLLLT